MLQANPRRSFSQNPHTINHSFIAIYRYSNTNCEMRNRREGLRRGGVSKLVKSVIFRRRDPLQSVKVFYIIDSGQQNTQVLAARSADICLNVARQLVR
jgi:hypothetical protein